MDKPASKGTTTKAQAGKRMKGFAEVVQEEDDFIESPEMSDEEEEETKQH